MIVALFLRGSRPRQSELTPPTGMMASLVPEDNAGGSRLGIVFRIARHAARACAVGVQRKKEA
jgi:hypothetical protein